jgi:hypothetical protein
MMVHARAKELVYGVEARGVVLDASVGMQGWAETMAQRAALARPVRGDHVGWHDLGVLGTAWLDQCWRRASSSWAW